MPPTMKTTTSPTSFLLLQTHHFLLSVPALLLKEWFLPHAADRCHRTTSSLVIYHRLQGPIALKGQMRLWRQSLQVWPYEWRLRTQPLQSRTDAKDHALRNICTHWISWSAQQLALAGGQHLPPRYLKSSLLPLRQGLFLPAAQTLIFSTWALHPLLLITGDSLPLRKRLRPRPHQRQLFRRGTSARRAYWILLQPDQAAGPPHHHHAMRQFCRRRRLLRGIRVELV
jgi:hypothetical protein